MEEIMVAREERLAPPTSRFSKTPRTAAGHFRLNFYAAVYALVNYVRQLQDANGRSLEAILEKYPFVHGYLDEMLPHLPEEIGWNAALAWWRASIGAWEEGIGDHLPLRALTAAGINGHSRLALLLVGLVEEDSRFGTLLAYLQAPLSYRRPTLELVGQAVAGVEGLDLWQVCRPLLENGLLEALNPEAPRAEWVLRVPPPVWDAVRGTAGERPASWCRHHEAHEFPEVQTLTLPGPFRTQLAQLPALIQGGKADAIVLRGSRGSDRLRVMGAVGRALGRDLLVVEPGDKSVSWSGVGPYCTLARTMPVLTYDLGPGETATLPDLRGYNGPVGVIMGHEGGLRGEKAERAVSLTLPLLREADRYRCWRTAFGEQPVAQLRTISERYHLPAGHIRQVATMATAQAALQGREEVTPGDVQEACRTLNRQELDTLATRLDGYGSWDLLVTSAMMAARLDELERRCRHRERLLDRLAPVFGAGKNRGVRALFTGASGTGKTLAARILAAELGMDLYRVDLAAVVNKYIGETEKNLHQVLSRAEELDVILLLDEGDALLGSRTEVKSANDRYANLETDYLLQRLENYEGIVLITTNLGENIDRAFLRRMDVVVGFVAPGAAERWRIWQLHLPPDHAVSPAFLQEIATRCSLTGGQIRNAAQEATLLALDEGEVVHRRHLTRAVQIEYRKAGAVFPLHGQGERMEDRAEEVDAFVSLSPY
jgi:hypothetical protein